MENFNYRSNSDRSRSAENKDKIDKPAMAKVVSTEVKVKKENGFSKFIHMFVSPDIVDVKSFLVEQALRYGKIAFLDIMQNLLNGKDPISSFTYADRRNYGNTTRIMYDKQYGRPQNPVYTEPATARCNYDEFIFPNAGEAEMVLLTMNEAIRDYGIVTVLDLYDAVGVTPTNTMDKYGWTDLTTAKIVHVRGEGYVIKFPRPMPIN